jgi:hypothetical protein
MIFMIIHILFWKHNLETILEIVLENQEQITIFLK